MSQTVNIVIPDIDQNHIKIITFCQSYQSPVINTNKVPKQETRCNSCTGELVY